jgi:hypothetical protein
VGLVMVWDGKPCKRQRDGAESKAHTWSTLLNHLQAPASPTLLRSFPKKKPLFPPIFLVSLLVEERAGGGGGRRGRGFVREDTRCKRRHGVVRSRARICLTI